MGPKGLEVFLLIVEGLIWIREQKATFGGKQSEGGQADVAGQ